MHIADRAVFTPKWSEQIHQEWTRNLQSNRPDLTANQLQKTVDAMNEAFPNATVYQYEALLSTILLPDPDDNHVLAAAIIGQAHIIVTANLKDFPNEYLSQFDIEAQHPDQFIASLIELNSQDVLRAFQSQVTNLKKPTRTTHEVLQTLRKTGLETTANLILSLVDNTLNVK